MMEHGHNVLAFMIFRYFSTQTGENLSADRDNLLKEKGQEHFA